MHGTVGTGKAGIVRGFLLCGIGAGGALRARRGAGAGVTGCDDAAAADAAHEDEATGNAILVTATKRETTLQDAPVAVSVTTAETIERAQIRDLRDLQTVVPSLSVGQRQSAANTNFFIRGFGNGANNAGIEPSVGVFVDNVYRSRTARADHRLCPTCSGSRCCAGRSRRCSARTPRPGVVSITTQEPQFEFGGSAELTYGNYDQIIAKGLVTGPISDATAAFSLAAGINKRDGFFRDLGTGDRTNERDRWFVRGQFLLDPRQRLPGAGRSPTTMRSTRTAARWSTCRTASRTPVIRALGGQVNTPAETPSTTWSTTTTTRPTTSRTTASRRRSTTTCPTTSPCTSITAFRETDAVTVQDSDFTSADLIYPNFAGPRRQHASPRSCA